MVCGCNQVIVKNNPLNSPANSARVIDIVYPIPHLVIKCYMLYFYFAFVG